MGGRLSGHPARQPAVAGTHPGCPKSNSPVAGRLPARPADNPHDSGTLPCRPERDSPASGNPSGRPACDPAPSENLSGPPADDSPRSGNSSPRQESDPEGFCPRFPQKTALPPVPGRWVFPQECHDPRQNPSDKQTPMQLYQRRTQTMTIEEFCQVVAMAGMAAPVGSSIAKSERPGQPDPLPEKRKVSGGAPHHPHAIRLFPSVLRPGDSPCFRNLPCQIYDNDGGTGKASMFWRQREDIRKITKEERRRAKKQPQSDNAGLFGNFWI